MDHKRKLLELKSQREDLLKQADEAIVKKDKAAYADAHDKIKAINDDIKMLEDQIAERERYAGITEQPKLTKGAQDAAEQSRAQKLAAIIKTDAYRAQFFKALRNSINPHELTEGYEDLYKAMTLAGGDPAGSDGGFLAPPDFDTRVIELARDMLDLSEYVNVIPVNSATGWRIVEMSAERTAMQKIGEMVKAEPGKNPKFKRIDFNCETYGDYIPVSGELMDDADGLMEYLAQWFAKKFVATKNALILGVLNKKEAKVIEGESDGDKVKAIKTVLNKGIPTAASKKAIILTNQDGYNEMDNWANELGIPYLKPDVSGDFERLKNRPVIYGDNDVIESADENVAPVFIGDPRSAVALFIRNGMRIGVTNVGGDAWRNHGYEVRASCQMDCHEVDSAAVAKCTIAVEA